MEGAALLLSLKLATCTTVLLAGFGIPLAHWLAHSRSPWRSLAETVLALPLVLPPTVLGYYLLRATSPHVPFGSFAARLFGHPLPFSFEGLLLGSLLYTAPFALQPAVAAFAQVDPRLSEAARCLGATRRQAFWRVTLPLAWPGIVSGLVLGFAHALGEFGVVLMLGGNIPGQTRTLSIALYDSVQALDERAAAQTALVLLAMCVVGLFAAQRLRRIGGRR
jgi:molybdate transport system permease protein